MRLVSITLANFRGFAEEAQISLDADVVVIWGPNGTGKTSVLDAIQWLVLGDIPRLKSTALRPAEDYVSSRYATGPPSVTLALEGGEGRVLITRTGVGKEQRLTVGHGTHQLLGGREAEAFVADLFPTSGRATERPLQTYLLEQDDMRELLTGDTKERYRMLADLTGLTELQELDARLQSELKALRKAQRERDSEVRRAQAAVESLESDWRESETLLRERSGAYDEAIAQAATAVRALTGAPTAEPAPALLQIGQGVLTEVRVMADEVRHATEAMGQLAPTAADDLAGQRDAIASHENALSDVDARLELLQNRLLEVEDAVQAQERRHTKDQQLAALALEDLGPECPVCGQVHDVENTERRLVGRLAGANSIAALRKQMDALRNQVSRAQEERGKVDAELRRLRAQLEAAETARTRATTYESLLAGTRQRLLSRLHGDVAHDVPAEVAATSWAAQLEERLTELRARLRDAEERGRLSQSVAALGQDRDQRRVRLHELRTDAEQLRTREAKAADVCKWLGSAIVEITGTIVDQSTPLAGELFKRFDVHPTFRRFAFEPDRYHAAGHLRPWIYDDDAEHPRDADATHVLSAAQLNALAVCVFLAVNLENTGGCRSVLLDDPVQSMDDVNVLSLADVLRALRKRRQVVLTTHEMTLAQMLTRKLRPTVAEETTLLIKLSRWTRRGPAIELERDVFDDATPEIQLIGSPGGTVSS